MSSPALTLQSRPRPLAARDLDRVVWIDASLRGRTRRAYFERRLAAAARDPERHLQLGVETDGRLAGYMLGRALEGEFGRTEPEVRLEAFGVVGAAQGQGLGAALLGRSRTRRRGAGCARCARPRSGASTRSSPSSTAPASGSRRCTSSTARSTKPSSARRARRRWSPARSRRSERLRLAAPRGLRAARARRGRDRRAVAGRPRRRGAHRPPPYRPRPPRLSVPHRGRGARRFGAARVARGASTARSRAMSWRAWTTVTLAAPSPSR